jgi:hypothetical protein
MNLKRVRAADKIGEPGGPEKVGIPDFLLDVNGKVSYKCQLSALYFATITVMKSALHRKG